MELTKAQIQEIDVYISACGIHYYDVKAEIVDHFATILEAKLAKNPLLDFKKEMVNIHIHFSENGFSEFVNEKTKAVKKRFYKESFWHFLSFFIFF